MLKSVVYEVCKLRMHMHYAYVICQSRMVFAAAYRSFIHLVRSDSTTSFFISDRSLTWDHN